MKIFIEVSAIIRLILKYLDLSRFQVSLIFNFFTKELVRISKVIAIINENDEISKTTSATNMAYLLCKKNKKVLLIDFDRRANYTMIIEDINHNEIDITILTLIKAL